MRGERDDLPMSRIDWYAVLGVSLLASLGCGGGSGGKACSAATDCGGDLVGNWKMIDSCIDLPVDPGEMDFCPSATMSSSMKASGSASFRADGTYTTVTTAEGSLKMTLPSACLTQSGITLTCDQLNQAFAQMFTSEPDSPFKSFNCTGAGSGCACTFTMNAQTETEEGTYVTSGNTLTTTSSFASESSNYCVTGDELAVSVIPPDDETGTMVLLFKKQ
jgi:hypothetical protein